MSQRPYDFPGDPELAHLIAAQGGPARHLDHRDRRRPPADLLRHHQRVGVPRPGPAGQAVDLDRRLPDRGHRRQPAARPGPRRRDRRVRPQGRADRLRRALAHVLAAAQAARSRGGGRRAHLHRRGRGGRLRAARVVPRGRPCPGARHHAGVLPVQARSPVRPLPDDDRRARRGRLPRDRRASTASTRTRSAPARCTSGSTGPRAASPGPEGHPRTPTSSARTPAPSSPLPAEQPAPRPKEQS